MKPLKCLLVFPFMLLGIICGVIWEAFYAGLIFGIDWFNKFAESCISEGKNNEKANL